MTLVKVQTHSIISWPSRHWSELRRKQRGNLFPTFQWRDMWVSARRQTARSARISVFAAQLISSCCVQCLPVQERWGKVLSRCVWIQLRMHFWHLINLHSCFMTVSPSVDCVWQTPWCIFFLLYTQRWFLHKWHITNLLLLLQTPDGSFLVDSERNVTWSDG